MKVKAIIFILAAGLLINALFTAFNSPDYDTNLDKCREEAQSLGVDYKDLDVLCSSLGADNSISSSEYNSKTKHLEINNDILTIFEQNGFTYNNEIYPDNVNVHMFKKQYDVTTELLISFDNNSSFRSIEIYNGELSPNAVGDKKTFLSFIPKNPEPYFCEEYISTESETGIIEYDTLDYSSSKIVECSMSQESIPDVVINDINILKKDISLENQ